MLCRLLLEFECVLVVANAPQRASYMVSEFFFLKIMHYIHCYQLLK